MEKLQNYINGQLIPPTGNTYIDNYHPATGKVYSLIPDSDASDIPIAVDAAKAAFPSWSVTPAEKRMKIMMRVAEIVQRDLEAFAQAESKDNGKPVSLACCGYPACSKQLRIFCNSDYALCFRVACDGK